MNRGDESRTQSTRNSCSVAIIGAGIAGIAAARVLSPYFKDLVVVEATEHVGGRIKQVHDVLPWPVELGPEFIHGCKSSFQNLLIEADCKFKEYKWPDRWFFQEDKRLQRSADTEKDADIGAVMDKFEGIGNQEYPATDMSVEQWLRDGGATDRMVDIADACFANDFGCSISQLGLREAITENQRWDSGETYLVLDRSLASVVEYISQPVISKIRTNWPVTAVRYGNREVEIDGPMGRKLYCAFVIVTVPLKILQQNDILFHPPLPDEKLGALDRIKMSNAIKVILAFDCAIWPKGFFDVVCPGGFIPEFWVTSYPEDPRYSGAQLFGITGFVTGKRAEDMSQLPGASIVRRALAQLDDVFGSGQSVACGRHPATSAFVRAHIADWSKERYVRGAYSYPSLGAKVGDREILAESLDGKVYFAGEATHPAINPCIQAAFETGVSAAKQVLAASKQLVRSRL